MPKLLRILLLLFVLFCSKIGIAQRHTFIHYTTEDGLPQSQIHDIIQDKNGFIWFSTSGGISKFDGKTFENYSTLNGLSNNQSRDLAIDKYEQLWILDLDGLTNFNGYRFQHFPTELPISFTKEMFCDGDSIWFGCDLGLVKFYNGNYKLYPLEKCKNKTVDDIHRDKKGNLWVFTREESFIFKNDSEDLSTLLALPQISKVIETDSNSFLLSPGKGIYIDYSIDKLIPEKNNYSPTNLIKDFAVENDGNTIWIATSNSVTQCIGENKMTINEKNGLEYNNIQCIFIDRENILWIGTDGNGVYKYTGNLISIYTEADGLNSDLTMGITEFNNEMYVLSFNKGINIISKDSIYSLPEFEDFGLSKAWCITGGEDVWAGFNSGLLKISKNQKSLFTEENGLLNNRITALYYDEVQNALLVGSENGYSLIKDDKISVNTIENGFPVKRIRMFKRDKENNLWFAGINGIAKYNGDDYKVYTVADGLLSNSTYNIEFYNNKVWIGTKNGLCYIDNDSIHAFSLGNNPKDISINLLIGDERGKLWVGTNNGIYSIYIDEKKDVFLEHYGLQNGLLGLETNMNAAYLDKNGNLFFGSEKGLVRFDRNELEILKKRVPPKVVINSLQIYLKDIDWIKRGDSLSYGSSLPVDLLLEPNENYLTFTFSGINMQNPTALRYRFMLLGAEGELSENWSNPTINNFATFSNLSSGHYTFRAQSSANSGSWPAEYSEYSFIIKTPYYASWWFRTLSVLLTLSLLYSIYSFRIKSLKQKQEVLFLQSRSKMLALEQQTLNANMNRHFVFNALNSIQYYLNKEDKLSANKYLSRFAKLIRKNLDSSQSKQTTLKEEIDRMVLYMELEQMRFSDKFTFSFEVDPTIITREINIPSMLFQPYLENSIWHGILPMEQLGKIEVSICAVNSNSIKISIFDNGIGIDTSMKQKGEQPNDHISVGMQITKNRLELYQQINNKEASVVGPFEVKENGITIGTKVELILPLLEGSEK